MYRNTYDIDEHVRNEKDKMKTALEEYQTEIEKIILKSSSGHCGYMPSGSIEVSLINTDQNRILEGELQEVKRLLNQMIAEVQ